MRRRPSRAQLRRRVRALERHGDTLRARNAALEARVEELEAERWPLIVAKIEGRAGDACDALLALEREVAALDRGAR